MIDPKQGPFPGLPTFGELHTELARHRRRDPDAKLIAAYDALLVLCERITVLEAEARKPYMPAARVRAMGGYEPGWANVPMTRRHMTQRGYGP